MEGIAFSPDGTTVATTADDKSVKLWRASDGAELRTISTGANPLDTVRFSPDGAWVIGCPSPPGSIGQGATIWDSPTGSLLKSLSGSSNAVVSTSASVLLMTVLNGGIHRFSLTDFTYLGTAPSLQTAGGRSIDITANGSMLADITAGSGVVLRPWLQAFGWKTKTYSVDYILTQVRVSNEKGGIGFLFWNARNDYAKPFGAMPVMATNKDKYFRTPKPAEAALKQNQGGSQ